MKKSAAALLLATTLTLTGCSESILTSKTAGDDTTASTVWDTDDNKVIAWVVDDSMSDEDKKGYDITFGDFYSEYTFTLASNGIDENSSEYADMAKNYRSQLLDLLTREHIVLKKAADAGLDVLTDEETAEINKSYEDNLLAWYNSYESQAKEELGDTSDIADDVLQNKERELFNEYLASFGLSEETFLKWQTNNFIYNKMMQEVSKDITVTDEEAQEQLDTTLADAKRVYDEERSRYENAPDYLEVWLPEGSRNIKFILLEIDSADAAEIAAGRAESDPDTEALDKLRDEKLDEIKGQADAALQKLKNGTEFDAVLKEYGANYSESTEGQTTLIVKDSIVTMESLYDAAYALKEPGDFTDLIATDRGYYILQYVSDAKITDDDLKKVKEQYKEEMLADKQSALQQETVDKWLAEVTYEYDYDALNIDPPTESNSSDTSTASDTASASDTSSQS